jgi:hypothetical protein
MVKNEPLRERSNDLFWCNGRYYQPNIELDFSEEQARVLAEFDDIFGYYEKSDEKVKKS